MLHFFKKDLVEIFRSCDPRPPLDEGSDCRLLLGIINDAYVQTDDQKQRRIFLERGIEFTGMSTARLSERALELGYKDLAEAYKTYSPGD